MSVQPSTGRGSALKWFKSSHSSNEGPDCVEIAVAPTTIHVRDSKNAQGPQLAFAPQQWAAFVAYTGDQP